MALLRYRIIPRVWALHCAIPTSLLITPKRCLSWWHQPCTACRRHSIFLPRFRALYKASFPVMKCCGIPACPVCWMVPSTFALAATEHPIAAPWRPCIGAAWACVMAKPCRRSPAYTLIIPGQLEPGKLWQISSLLIRFRERNYPHMPSHLPDNHRKKRKHNPKQYLAYSLVVRRITCGMQNLSWRRRSGRGNGNF